MAMSLSFNLLRGERWRRGVTHLFFNETNCSQGGQQSAAVMAAGRFRGLLATAQRSGGRGWGREKKFIYGGGRKEEKKMEEKIKGRKEEK